MAQVSNPIAGVFAVASGEIIYQRSYVVASGAILGPGIAPNVGNPETALLTTINLPNLNWLIFLHDTYTQPSTGIVFTSQNDITWQPLIQNFKDDGGLVAGPSSLPLAAPLIMPVGTPIRFAARIGTQDMGWSVGVPAGPPATLNLFTVLLCATQ